MRGFKKVLIVSAMALSLPGCTAALMAASGVADVETFSTTDQLVLSSAPSNFIDDTITIMEAMEYQVSAIRRPDNSVSFTTERSFSDQLLMRSDQIQVNLVLADDNRTIDIEALMVGNYGADERAAVEEQLGIIKTNLAEGLN